MPCRTAAARVTTLALLSLSSTTAGAQAHAPLAAGGTDALPELARYLAANGRAASRAEYVTTYEYALTASGRCEATLRESTVMANKEELLEYTLRLGALSPEVGVEPWPNQPLVSVRLWTTTGSDDIAVKVRRARYGKPPSQVRGVGIVLTDRQTADTVAVLLREGIQTCGGQPEDSIVVAQRLAKDADVRARLSALTGAGLTANQRADVVSACETAVRGTLKSPASAVFGPDPTVLTPKPGQWMVMGQVEAENSFGGRLQNKYSCLVDAFGKQFVSQPAILY